MSLEFLLEDELMDVLRRLRPSRLLKKGNPKTLRLIEFQVGMRVPDILIVTCQGSFPSLKRRLSNLSIFESAVVAEILQNGARKRTQIRQRLYASASALDRVLDRLTRVGVVEKRPDGTLKVSNGIIPAGVQIIAVEGKLLKWKEAVEQAKEYLDFSNAAFVAMPSEVVRKNSHIGCACRKEGLGLIAVSKSHKRILVKPIYRKVMTAERVWLLSRTVGLAYKDRRGLPRNHQMTPVSLKKRSRA